MEALPFREWMPANQTRCSKLVNLEPKGESFEETEWDRKAPDDPLCKSLLWSTTFILGGTPRVFSFFGGDGSGV